MKLRTKYHILKSIKHYFKANKYGVCQIDYKDIDPETGAHGCRVFKYKDAKFEINYAIKNKIQIAKIYLLCYFN